MFKVAKIKIGIINCVTGKVIREKTVDPELALQEAKKISRWFDRQDTFFSGKPIWKHWEILGMSKFEGLAAGTSHRDLAVESIVVFEEGKAQGEEHEFYMQKVR